MASPRDIPASFAPDPARDPESEPLGLTWPELHRASRWIEEHPRTDADASRDDQQDGAAYGEDVAVDR